MKLLKLSAFIIITSLLVVSCSSDNEMTITAPINGKWYYKEYQVKGDAFPYEGHESCGKDYIQFGDNGLGKQVDVLGCTEYADNFEYTFHGNTITITYDGQTASGGVMELSDTILRIKNVFDFDHDGVLENVISVYTKE